MKKKAFLSAGEAARALGVSVKTIQRWDVAGLIPVIRTSTNQRRIPVEAIETILKTQRTGHRCAIYARVSSVTQEQAGNLARQSERLEQVAFERGYEVVALIGEQASSLNEKRKGFWRLLRLIEQQAIDVVLIEYPDRLVRFGFSFLEECFGWKGVRLEVVEPPKAQHVTEELTQDLLTIITVFSGRLSGQRAKHVRACMKTCLEGAGDGTSE
jgi:putative resolvase